MACRLSFRYLEPTFFAGLLDDPVLWVKVRPWGRSLLFDCGQLHHLAKRVLKSVAAVFISHAHMDHFMGFDTLVRQVLVSPRTFDVFGPPGLADKVEHKLAAYDWNLHEHFWCSFRVHELSGDRVYRWIFPGPQRFIRCFEGQDDRLGGTIFENRWVKVEARQASHRIPVLVYRLTEKAGFSLDAERIATQGLVGGPWIDVLKRQFYHGLLGRIPLSATRFDENGHTIAWLVENTRELYENICRRQSGASIGYLTDIGFSRQNQTVVTALLKGVRLLVGECAFLADHKQKARRSFHLCTQDVNRLLVEIQPDFYMPMHLSKSCSHRSGDLYLELCPPPETRLVCLPDRLLHRPFLPCEVPMDCM
jgi:ribonuclease Z